MLNALRKSAGTWVVRIFLMLLVLSFAAWGIGDIFRVRTDTGVISIGEREVSGAELVSAFNRDLRRLQSELGTGIDSQQARDMGLLQATVQQTIARGLFDEATREMGLAVPDAALSREIRENPAFKDEFGRFDRFRFESVLRENGFSEEAYVQATRRDLARQQLLDSLVAGVPAPNVMAEAFYRFQEERRVASVLRVPNTRLAEVAPPGEDELQSYHAAHAARYTAPELRSLSFFTLTPQDLVEQVTVSEEELREIYQYRIAEFSVEAEREVEQILVDDQAKAEAAAKRIAEGADFHAVAKEVAGMDAEGTRLGKVTRQSLPLPEATVDRIFALPEGGVSEPVETDLGWHVFRVTKVVAEASTRSFEEVRNELREEVRLERAADLMFEAANKIEDAFAAGDRPEEVAQQFGLTLTRVEGVDRRGNDRNGQPVAALPPAPEFLSTAFEEAAIGDEPRLYESENGSYYFVRVDAVIEPAVRPLAEVREQVVADWTGEKRLAAAAERAQALAERVRGGTSLEALQQEVGGELAGTDALRRDEFGGRAGVSEEVVRHLFEAGIGDVVTGSNAAGDAQVIARLSEIQVPAPGDAPAAMDRLRTLVQRAIAEDVRGQYQLALRDSIDVSVNQRAIETLFDETPVR